MLPHWSDEDAERFAEAVHAHLKPMIKRTLGICANDLDIIATKFTDIADVFWIIGNEYSRKLTEQQIHEALRDYEAMLKRRQRFYRGYPGVNRGLL